MRMVFYLLEMGRLNVVEPRLECFQRQPPHDSFSDRAFKEKRFGQL
jgi:hypothetical protein